MKETGEKRREEGKEEEDEKREEEEEQGLRWIKGAPLVDGGNKTDSDEHAGWG